MLFLEASILLILSAVIRAQHVIDAESGCVDISLQLPAPFKVFRLDATNYEFDGVDKCVNALIENDEIPCSLTEEGEGYLATAHVCEVEKHISAGFRPVDYLQDSRFAYFMVYFSHGGTWKGIQNNCIQPQHSGPTEIAAGGRDEVEIVCVRNLNCPMGPYSTILTATQDLCRDYSEPKCEIRDTRMARGLRFLKTKFRRPQGESKSYVFCSTLDSFLSYVVDWEAK